MCARLWSHVRTIGLACYVGWVVPPVHAQALWVWQDAQGHTTMSDVEPPHQVPEHRIVSRPQDADRHSTRQPGPAITPYPAPAVQGAVSLSAREVVRRDNCLRAQASLDTLRQSPNVVVEDAQGHRVPMDTGLRRAETARLRQIMRDNCTYAN